MSLSEMQRSKLESLVAVGYDGSVAVRAQIVLGWYEGWSATELAARFGTTRPTVYKWVYRFDEGGVAALESRKSPGAPRTVSESERSRIVALTKLPPPEGTGLSHWSSYEMAKYLRRYEGISVSHNFVAQLWREHGLKPHRHGTFKTPTDPEFTAKVVDIVGLYLDPPDKAIVLSFDEKTQVQALDRTQPLLPISFGKTEKRTHDYVRHGVTNLFAALNVLTGKVTAQTFNHKRTKEFLRFMNRLVKEHPADQEIHVILDNLKTHNNPQVEAWLAKHPNITFHFTPTGSSWLNQIEIWFGIITRQAIRRGSFNSVAHLIQRIENYTKQWNEDAEPFEWTATADDILEKVAMLDQDYKKLVANNLK